MQFLGDRGGILGACGLLVGDDLERADVSPPWPPFFGNGGDDTDQMFMMTVSLRS
jgi:hypothetical protein